MKGSVLIYGWSMSEQDQHILEALDHEGITSIGISVFTEDKEWESKCLSMESKIKATRHLKETPLTFFNSRSNGCWIY